MPTSRPGLAPVGLVAAPSSDLTQVSTALTSSHAAGVRRIGTGSVHAHPEYRDERQEALGRNCSAPDLHLHAGRTLPRGCGPPACRRSRLTFGRSGCKVRGSSPKRRTLWPAAREKGCRSPRSDLSICRGGHVMSRLRWFFVAACLWAIGPTAAGAANVNFIENGDVLTIQPDANWECGVTFTTTGENGHLDGCWITNSPPG